MVTVSSALTVSPVPTMRSFVCRVIGTVPAGIVIVGSVLSAGSMPAGMIGKFAIGDATTLGLVVQPSAWVGTGGGGAELEGAGEPLDATGEDAEAAGLLLPDSTIASTIATIATTAAAEPPIVIRWRAFARAAARSCRRRS